MKSQLLLQSDTRSLKEGLHAELGRNAQQLQLALGAEREGQHACVHVPTERCEDLVAGADGQLQSTAALVPEAADELAQGRAACPQHRRGQSPGCARLGTVEHKRN